MESTENQEFTVDHAAIIEENPIGFFLFCFISLTLSFLCLHLLNMFDDQPEATTMSTTNTPYLEVSTHSFENIEIII